VRFVVALDEDLLERLNARADEERQREQVWLQDARERALDRASSLRERVLGLAAVRAERARRRDAGELLGSRDALLAHQVRRLLRDRGWDHEWAEPPRAATSTPGRRWGVIPDDDRGGPARLPVQLPDELGERVRRAAWWTSAEAVQDLIEWQERWGPGPGAALGEAAAGNPMAAIMMFSAILHRPSAEAMAARDAARSKIVTVGDILRWAAVGAV
jgi:hypothetical protein